ncbi:hypothetical protein CSKR_102338 [Clonorchis sinensis]|uniref:Uncharacterized protein n=1 Tax=Clonorchis sinensis TaxID=79923 RepID=A0A3R7CZW1_CLOSI|nr:hypothetical protein CSKR_102338 [Clonorchis sinensis]
MLKILRQPTTGFTLLGAHQMESPYMYRDMSNIVPTETWGGLVQHIQLLENVINDRFTRVPGEPPEKRNLFAKKCIEHEVDGNVETAPTKKGETCRGLSKSFQQPHE